MTTEGLSCLTVKRLAGELRCSVGTVYNIFPSKDALVAELQREAIEVLYASFLVSQTHLDDLASVAGLTPRVRALSHVVAAARFLAQADEVYPHEVELSRLVFADPTFRLSDQEAGRVAPAAFRMLEHLRQLLDDASETGALGRGANLRRAVIMVAGMTGVQISSLFSGFDPDLFPPSKLASAMVTDLLLGWGASPDDIATAEDLCDVLAEHGQLVPRSGRT